MVEMIIKIFLGVVVFCGAVFTIMLFGSRGRTPDDDLEQERFLSEYSRKKAEKKARRRKT